MALIEMHPEFKGLRKELESAVKVLERIADALDRAYPLPQSFEGDQLTQDNLLFVDQHERGPWDPWETADEDPGIPRRY
jgi:hypothetical protein